MYRYILLMLLCAVSYNGWSQPLVSAGKNAASVLSKQTAGALSARGVQASQAAVLRAQQALQASATKARLAKMLEQEDKCVYNPAGVPEAFRKRNQVLSVKRHFLFQKNLELFFKTPNPAQAQYARKVDYAGLIPASARLIFLGEIHGRESIHREIYQLIKDYRQAYPNRHIYILAESVADDGIIYHAGNWGKSGPYSKQGLSRDQMLETLVKEQGVFLTGLERPALVRLYNTALNVRQRVVRKYISASGQEIRNRGFLEKIAQLRRLDPQGIFFVYGGKAHWSYNVAGSVPLGLNVGQTFVIDFIPHGWRIEGSAESIWNLWLEKQTPPAEGVYGIYRAQNKESARMMGSDLKIETPYDFLPSWR